MAMTMYRTIVGDFVFKDYKMIASELYETYTEAQSANSTVSQKFAKATLALDVLPNLSEEVPDLYARFCTLHLEETKRRIQASIGREQLVGQVINNISDIEMVVNILVKRLREWYALYLPEVSNTISDHEKFVGLILAHPKEALMEQFKITLTMGSEFPQEDIAQMMRLATQVQELYLLKESHTQYLTKLMEELCPNLTAVAGPVLGAKLLSHTGTLKSLAELPSSTIQLLGAEKALFRHLKTKARCPRHGYIVQHPLLAGAKQSLHGKIARHLSSAISLCVRIDYFSTEHSNTHGVTVRKKLDALFGGKR